MILSHGDFRKHSQRRRKHTSSQGSWPGDCMEAIWTHQDPRPQRNSPGSLRPLESWPEEQKSAVFRYKVARNDHRDEKASRLRRSWRICASGISVSPNSSKSCLPCTSKTRFRQQNQGVTPNWNGWWLDIRNWWENVTLLFWPLQMKGKADTATVINVSPKVNVPKDQLAVSSMIQRKEETWTGKGKEARHHHLAEGLLKQMVNERTRAFRQTNHFDSMSNRRIVTRTRPACEYWHLPNSSIYKKRKCNKGNKCPFCHLESDEKSTTKKEHKEMIYIYRPLRNQLFQERPKEQSQAVPISKRDEAMAQERDKNPTQRVMCPTEPKRNKI